MFTLRLNVLSTSCLLFVACVPPVTADPNDGGSTSDASSSDTATATATASGSESTTQESGESASEGDGDGDTSAGDGDGDGSTGDGDGSTGDGDGSTGDGDGSTGDGDGSTGDGDGDTGMVDCSGTCIEAPGAPWSDIFAQRDTNGSCGDAYADEMDTFYGGFSAGSASCDCTCSGSPSGGTCPQTLAFYNSTTACPTGPGSGGNVSVGSCFSDTGNYWATSTGTPNGVNCGTGTVTENIPTPTWASSDLACNGDALGETCADTGDVCMPTPGSPFVQDRLCVSQAGNHTCPADFPNKSVLYTGYDDTQACASTCGCSSGDAKCVAQYTGYQGIDCNNPAGASSFDTDDGYFCILQSPISSTDSVIVTSNTVSGGTCSPSSTVNPTGSASPTGETTVCCST